MVCAHSLLDWDSLVYLFNHSTLFCHSQSIDQTSNQWNNRYVFGRRCLSNGFEHDAQGHRNYRKSLCCSRTIWAIQTLVLFWSGRSRNCNDVSFRICDTKEYPSQKRNGKSCLVVDFNCVSHYDAGSWSWCAKRLCWYASLRLAEYRYNAADLPNTITDYRHAAYWGMEIQKAETPRHLNCFSSKSFHIFIGTNWKI